MQARDLQSILYQIDQNVVDANKVLERIARVNPSYVRLPLTSDFETIYDSLCSNMRALVSEVSGSQDTSAIVAEMDPRPPYKDA